MMRFNNLCAGIKSRLFGRFSRRVLASVVIIFVILMLTEYLQKNVNNGLFKDLPLLLSALVAYIFYLDQKKLEKVYEAKLNLYQSMLMELSRNYNIPIKMLKIFINSDAKKIDLSDLSQAPEFSLESNNLVMTLLASNRAVSVLTDIYRKIQEVMFSMTLLAFKKRIGVELKEDKEDENSSEIISGFKYLLDLYLKCIISLKELHDLNILLINEMRNDLEIGLIRAGDIKKISESHAASVEETFKFLKALIDEVFTAALASAKRREEGDQLQRAESE